jgi:hypothetical protein
LKKYDGVIEAVHYKDGHIAQVRMFERRGATWSDRVIVPRDQLLERLQAGKKLVTGRRIEFMGGTFETGAEVQAISRDGRQLLATRPEAEKDELEGVPLF